MRGVERLFKLDADYDTVEEFFAIVLTNIYMSEKAKGGRIALRRDHNGHKELRHPERFLDNVQHIRLPPGSLLEILRKDQDKLWNALVKIGPPNALFNPVRDWQTKRTEVLIDL